MGGDAGGGVVCVVAGDCEGRAVGFLVVGYHLGEGKVFQDRCCHRHNNEPTCGKVVLAEGSCN